MNCCECQSLCPECKRFASGDRIELNVSGILMLGSRMVGRGTVVGMMTKKGRVFIQINWDGYPTAPVARINPQHIRKVYEEEKAFI